MGHPQSKLESVHPRGPDVSFQDFTKYYTRIKKTLKDQDFRFSDPSDEITFERKISLCNGINMDAVNMWTSTYIDYMILAAWTSYMGETHMMYPPFAIHQVARLHALYTQNFSTFCNIITENKGIVPLSPLKMIARQNLKDYNIFKDAYNWTKEFLWLKVYNNPSTHKSNTEKEQAACIWEDFEISLMRSEFNFLFLQPQLIDELTEQLLPCREGLLMDSHNNVEIFRVAKDFRDILGIGELISASQRACPSLMDTFIKELSSPEQEVAQRIHSLSFKIRICESSSLGE